MSHSGLILQAFAHYISFTHISVSKTAFQSRSETIFFTIVVFLLSLDHVNQLVIDLAWILDVQVLSRDKALSKDCHNDILEDSPAVLQIQVDLISEGLWCERLKADNLMRLVRRRIDTLHEGEAHPIDSVKDGLDGPPVDLGRVV